MALDTSLESCCDGDDTVEGLLQNVRKWSYDEIVENKKKLRRKTKILNGNNMLIVWMFIQFHVV